MQPADSRAQSTVWIDDSGAGPSASLEEARASFSAASKRITDIVNSKDVARFETYLEPSVQRERMANYRLILAEFSNSRVIEKCDRVVELSVDEQNARTRKRSCDSMRSMLRFQQNNLAAAETHFGE